MLNVFTDFDFEKCAEIMENYNYTWYIDQEERETFALEPYRDYMPYGGEERCNECELEECDMCKFGVPRASFIKMHARRVFEQLWAVLTVRDYIEMDTLDNGMKVAKETKSTGRYNHIIQVVQDKKGEVSVELSLIFEAESA